MFFISDINILFSFLFICMLAISTVWQQPNKKTFGLNRQVRNATPFIHPLVNQQEAYKLQGHGLVLLKQQCFYAILCVCGCVFCCLSLSFSTVTHLICPCFSQSCFSSRSSHLYSDPITCELRFNVCLNRPPEPLGWFVNCMCAYGWHKERRMKQKQERSRDENDRFFIKSPQNGRILGTKLHEANFGPSVACAHWVK